MIVYANDKSGMVPRRKARPKAKRVVDSILRPVVPYRVGGHAHYHSLMKGWWEESKVLKNPRAMSDDEAALVWLEELSEVTCES